MAKIRGLKDAATDPLVEKEKVLEDKTTETAGKIACFGKILLALLVGIGAGLVMGKFFKFRL